MATTSTIVLPPTPSGIRTRSSMAPTRENMATLPMVLLPSRDDVPGNAHETAAAMNVAKQHIDTVGSGSSTPEAPSETATADTYAFAFDIDGVLIRGGKPIPEAIQAMKMLNGQNEWGIKV
jgi:hypothetical protein